ncbi:MAG: T9SS type A sorting domain-containing protein [Bacteroidia bacterium]|nr:T9SS type A sorting domain-containing protein [Bacteroidia bacterium]
MKKFFQQLHIILFCCIALLLILKINAYGQENISSFLYCGTDEMRAAWLKENPQYLPTVLKREDQLMKFTKQYSLSNKRTSGAYIIPVVFHVIHNFGQENISDAQILDGLRVLNNYFNKNSSDSTQIVSAFKQLSANCEIEFRLAQKDPNGNCTRGINRINSYLTSIGDHQVKNLIHWDPTRYLNIYIVANAAGLAGHCMMPADADTLPAWDGIVITHSYVGSIGTSTPTTQVSLSHEVGHYFNLQHTWGGNNVPGYYFLPCANQNKDCNIDDGVADTPTTIGWQSCNLNGASCGSTLDNVQNMMEYSYCNRMFTPGQKQRMHACLNSSIAGRNNLWSASNLAFTGVDGNSSYLCKADFKYSNRNTCQGKTVSFNNTSYNGIIDSVKWFFQGGTPAVSSLNDVVVTYNQTGFFNVKLVAYANGDSVIKKIDSLVFVTPASALQGQVFHQNFNQQFSFADSNYVLINMDSATTWQFNDTIDFANTGGCLWLNNYNNSIKQKDELITPALNLSGQSGIGIFFKYAYAQKKAGNNDKLSLLISKDCGVTWISRWAVSGNNLKTTDSVSTPFFPTNNQQWKDVMVSSVPGAFLTNGVKLKLSFESDGGNNIFIDDLTLTFTTGEQKINNSNFKIYPQPANDIIIIDNQFLFKASIYNTCGQLIYKTKNEALQQKIETTAISNGFYILEAEINGYKQSKKIVIQH